MMVVNRRKHQERTCTFECPAFQQAESEHAELFEVLRKDQLAGRM